MSWDSSAWLTRVPAEQDEDSEWVVLPVTSFTAFFANTSFDRNWLPALREGLIRQDETSFGVSRYKISEELLSGL